MIYIDRKSLMNKLQITKNAIIYLEKRCNIAKRNYKHVYYTEEELNIILDLVKKEFSLPEDVKQIPNSFDYATPNGEIYKQKFKRCKLYYKANLSINLGYVYGIINFTDRRKLCRIHRIIALTFIPNPKNLPYVGHKNNIKNDNRITNLYWTTCSENTKKAFDDGLLVNAKGYEDSQSLPVNMYDLNMNLLKSFGSISIASKETGIPKNTISNHCKNKIIPRKHKVIFRYQSEMKV